MKSNILYIIIISILFSCEKNEKRDTEVKVDYRRKYTGTYSFSTTKSIVSMCYDTSSVCINGWKEWNIVTTNITTSIMMVDSNKLEIIFGNDTAGFSENNCLDKEKVNVIVDSLGVLSLPCKLSGGHNRFEGSFIGLDTLTIKIHKGSMIGGYDKYSIIGILVK